MAKDQNDVEVKAVRSNDAVWQGEWENLPVICGMGDTTLEGVLRRVIGAIVKSRGLPPELVDVAASAIICRYETGGWAGVSHGIAIPHGFVNGINDMLVGVGVLDKDKSIDCKAFDARPSRVFVVILCPHPNFPDYKSFIARLSRCLMTGDTAERLASVTDAAGVRAILQKEACK